MTTRTTKAFRTLKGINLAQWNATFWLVKRKIADREAMYSVLRVDMDAKLQRRFKGYVREQLQSRQIHLEEYDFQNPDTDDLFLTMDADATDFVKVAIAIEQGFDNERAREYRDLLNSWAYVVLLEKGDGRLYAWRKINAMTQPKKVLSRKALWFQNRRLTDVDDEEVFLIDPHFDFFVYEGITFIANKREFESAMNFREGMKSQGSGLLDAIEAMNVLTDVQLVRDFVGDNLHHLRKLASIRKAGYYSQKDYVKRLMEVNDTEGWGLKVANGRIVVESATIELLLKLLNNDRLRSPINKELFDSAVKKKVGTSAQQ